MLKILVVIEKNSWIDSHIAGSLEEMGHKVHRFFYGDFIGEFYTTNRKNEQIEKNKLLINTAKELFVNEGLDLIFCYVQDDFLLPEYAQKLSKLDVPLVNYNVDMACQWYRQIRIAKYFSYILCAQQENINNIKRYTSRVLYFPMAARKYILNNSDSDFFPSAPVTFVGTPTDQRLQILSLLIKANTPLAIYGKYWKIKKTAEPIRNYEKTLHDIWYYGLPRLRAEGITTLIDILKKRFTSNKEFQNYYIPNCAIHEFISENLINLLFQRSKINLGFTRISGSNPYQKGKFQMKLRDFEVPLAGGFYLVEKTPGYEEFFSSDKEIVMWSSPDELKNKISYYLNHDKEREEIAKAGQKRALAEHTWEHRFSMLFQEIGIL